MPAVYYKVHKTSKLEREILEQAMMNPNLFTDFYLQSDHSGTWLNPEDTDSRFIATYKAVYKLWKKQGQPRLFQYQHDHVVLPRMVMPTRVMEVRVKPSGGQEKPIFQVHHGFWLQDWQVDFITAPQSTAVIIGGYAAAKTITFTMKMLIGAACLPGFRGFGLGAFSIQSIEIYNKIIKATYGTRYAERFLVGSPKKPYYKIVVANDYVGETAVEFYPILEDVEKIRNLEGDMAIIDQAELLPDLFAVRETVSSRLRGLVQGRRALGQAVFIANPDDNPTLWDLFDMGDENPQDIFSRRVETYDNLSLHEDEIARFERDVAADEAHRNTALRGFRPVGDGKHFPKASIERCRAKWLDDLMNDGLNTQKPGFVRSEAHRAGVFKWELPPDEGKNYMLIADPGTLNPPYRDAACIGVWDVTDLPDGVAHLRAFHWVYGNGSPDPWIQSFLDYHSLYKVKLGYCAYDSTGPQSGYSRWIEFFNKIYAGQLSLAGGKKYECINAAKTFMTHGKVQFPTIPGMIGQLANYDVPDDKKRQDIVMMIAMSCHWMQNVFHFNLARTERTLQREPSASRYRPQAGGRYTPR